MLPEHACLFCSGNGHEFSPEAGAVPCLLCNGSGYATLLGDLGPTHSQKRRPYVFCPLNRQLRIGTGRRSVAYTVAEFAPGDGFTGRAFTLHKLDGSGHYCCLIGPDTATCDCAGKTYLNTERANLRAWLRDEPEIDSTGCKHADALKVLLAGGWLDLPEPVPTDGDE